MLRKSSGCLASFAGETPERLFWKAKKWVQSCRVDFLKGLIKSYILSVLMSYNIDDMTNTVYISAFSKRYMIAGIKKWYPKS